MDYRKEIEIQDKVSDYYEQIRYSRPYSKAYQMWWTKKMLSMLSPENLAGRILDNGCGIGSHAEALEECSKDIIGLDISKEMLNKAKQRIDRIALADSQRLPFKDEAFNVVFSRSLLHHLPRPEEAVSEILRVLKDGGEAVFSDTNASLLSSLPRKMAKQKGEHFSGLHKNFYSKELEGVIQRFLHVDNVYYFGFIAYPLIGFPDMIDVFSAFPFKGFLAKIFMALDNGLAMMPLIKKQSWGIIIKATKRKEP